MVPLKRKAAAQQNGKFVKRRNVPADPFIDPSDDEDPVSDIVDSDADMEDAEAEDFVEEGSDADEEEVGVEDDEDSEADDGGDEDVHDGDANANGVPRADRRTGKSLFKPPTSDELQQLKETSDLFKSNLFKLQIDELLSEVRVDYNKTSPLEKALHKIKEILDCIGDVPEASLAEAISRLASEGVAVPFPHPAPPVDAQYKFAFKKPSKIFVVGSYLLKTVAKNPSGANGDVAVQMPESLFQEKDHVNYRYFYKRAYYLAVLASEFRKKRKELNVKVEFQAFQGDRRRPILVLRAAKDGKDTDFSKLGFCIRLFPTIPQTLFPAARLAPSRNNVRLAFINPSQPSDNRSEPPPTSRYNAAMLLDTAFVPHLNLLHHHVTNCAGFRDACVLGKVWLTQRGLEQSGGFNGFLFAMMMGYLLRTNDKSGVRRLGNSFSSYQLFKVTMEFLASHDFERDPIFMTPDGNPLDGIEFSLDAFLSNYDVVIVDPSGKINMAGGMSKAMLDELQFEAKLSIQQLNDTEADRFESLFLRKVDAVHLRYDNSARVPMIRSIPASYTSAVALDFPSLHVYLQHFIPKLLKRALTNRTKLVCARAESLPAWPCDQNPPVLEDEDIPIIVGLVLDVENSIRMVEHGPSPDDPTPAAEFRELWGEKSEVRRFKDGSILESVVFDCDGTLDQRAMVVGRMVGHLLQRHIGVAPKEGMTYWAGQFNRFLKGPGIEIVAPSFQTVMEAFSTFAKDLRALDDLPLSVTSVIPCAEGLRYSSVFIPQPRPEPNKFKEGYRPLAEALDVMIEFESSGRWPDDLEAIADMKLAFYIRIAETVTKQHPGTRAIVSKDDGGYLDVTPLSGYTFRCRIHHDREELLHERRVADQGVDTAVKEMRQASQAAYLQRYHHLPYHTLRMQNLCLRHPFLPHAIRLLKRWVAAHMLSAQIPRETLELIAARVFVDPSPWSEPSSPFVGFVRALELIRGWDWKREPLVVELEKGKLTAEMKAKAADLVQARSEGAKGPAMCIVTEKDTEGTWWGARKPERLIVDRLVALAGAALKHIEDAVAQGAAKEIAKLFVTPPKGYDVVIRLQPQRCPRFRQSLSFDSSYLASSKQKYKNLVSAKDREDALLMEFDPVEKYLEELEAAYSDIALFFHDRYGGTSIAVVWRPKVVVGGPWKVGLPFNSTPVLPENSTKKPSKQTWTVVPNFKAIAAEMERLGTGLVAGVEIITHLDE
ncbi:hypothetical protein HK104_000070 [Borealophlyctis nickersoniae]|nr:hypothetical protein HK104_000070 [Borealophlyctis nickersoniae]